MEIQNHDLRDSNRANDFELEVIMKPKLLTINIERCRPVGGSGEEQPAHGRVSRVVVNTAAAVEPVPVMVRVEIDREKKCCW